MIVLRHTSTHPVSHSLRSSPLGAARKAGANLPPPLVPATPITGVA
jgi:hypothetical protein